MRALLFFAVMGMLLCASTLALSDKKEEAIAAFEEGKALFKAKEFPEAADAFRKADKLMPNWKLLFNIAQSEAAAKRHGLALHAFEAYLSRGGDDLSVERREEVMNEVDRLRKMVGFVRIKAPDGAEVKIDGVERGTAPMTGQIPVAASVDHTVTAIWGDQELPTKVFMVVGGQSETVELKKPVAEETGPTPVTTEPGAAAESDQVSRPVDKGSSPLKGWGWATLGIGGAALIGGIVTGAMTASKAGELEDRCPDQNCPGEDDRDLKDSVDALALTTDILLPVGGALAVTGVILLIVNAKKGESGDDNSLSFAPVFAPGRGVLVLEKRF